MKRIYWRPSKVSRSALLLIALFSLSCFMFVEHVKQQVTQPYYQEKIDASRLTLKAFQALKERALKRRIKIDLESDPAESALIGQLMTSITSNTGHLEAKQTTINPNFAAVAVDLLKKAGVERGDYVAVGLSGSFPAINVALYAAMEVLGVRPVVISSASASQWGANNSSFSWLDMEKYLFSKKIFSFHSVATSMGGIEDRGLGMATTGKTVIEEIIAKSGLYYIQSKNYYNNLIERMSVYMDTAGDSKVKVYVNVGGGSISVGRYEGKQLYKPGLNKNLPFGAGNIDSVMTRFSRMGVPVVHFSQVKMLAERYGLPLAPDKMPQIGEGKIYFRMEYNRLAAGIALLAIMLCLYAFIRSDLGYRLTQSVRRSGKTSSARPEQMV